MGMIKAYLSLEDYPSECSARVVMVTEFHMGTEPKVLACCRASRVLPGSSPSDLTIITTNIPYQPQKACYTLNQVSYVLLTP